ncbi:MAG TPA: DUF421 domain-containing protein [Peptococcaceae bacterium]|nr:MAG: hypothetical protein XD50_0904 [Clostridia bacterium 41_269]HBT20884.1 DUF421 domain-containing protein [Peptococcaceae bacterium]
MGYIEVIIQTFLAFFAILFYTRILGKQQVGQLTFFEYINGITFGSIAAVLATDVGQKQTAVHLLALTLFAVLTFIMEVAALKSRPLRKIVAGEPTIVIHNGKVLEDNMKKMRYNFDELLMQLREKGVFYIGDVEYAILEPDGNLSVELKSQQKPVAREDLNMSSSYEGLSVELILDGKIMHQNLEQIGLDENWLLGELEKRGVKDVKEVKLAVLSSTGNLFVDLDKDDLNTPMDITDSAPNK